MLQWGIVGMLGSGATALAATPSPPKTVAEGVILEGYVVEDQATCNPNACRIEVHPSLARSDDPQAGWLAVARDHGLKLVSREGAKFVDAQKKLPNFVGKQALAALGQGDRVRVHGTVVTQGTFAKLVVGKVVRMKPLALPAKPLPAPPSCQGGACGPIPDGVIQDCAGSPTFQARTPAGGPRLWVLGQYEGKHDPSDASPSDNEVEWSLPGSNVLVVSAYSPATWRITLSEGAALDRVIVLGYHEQIVHVDKSVKVSVYTHELLPGTYACGYSMPYNGGGCDTGELIDMAKSLTGLPLTGFDGCYRASDYAYDFPFDSVG